MSDESPPGATRSRPVTESSYGIPDDVDATTDANEDADVDANADANADADANILPWSFVTDCLAADRTFWVTTTRPDGRPHARPTWGVWVDGTFYCGGGEKTRWVRNLAADPAISVHRESGTEVVIVEGVAEQVDSEDEQARVDSAYQDKYGTPHGPPVFAVEPDCVMAWSDFPVDATRWTFEG